MNNPTIHGLQVWPASVNPSDCELCLSNPLIHFFRRRLFLLPRFERSEALSRGMWMHYFFEHDDFATPLSALEAKLRAATLPLVNERKKLLDKHLVEAGLFGDRRTEAHAEERQDFEVALAIYLAASQVLLPSGWGGGGFREWLCQPHIRIIARENKVSRPLGITDCWGHELFRTGIFDLTFYNANSHAVFIVDLKSTDYSPLLRMQLCPYEFQTLQYLELGPDYVKHLISTSALPSDAFFAGVCHLTIRKPAIEFSGEDRNFILDESPLKSGPRKGQPRNERKYHGDPVHANYVRRCASWMNATDLYLHLAPERSADPVVNISTTTTKALYDALSHHYQPTVNAFVGNLCHATPDNMPRMIQPLLARGSISPYAPLVTAPPSEWLPLARELGFQIGKEPRALETLQKEKILLPPA